MSALLRVTGLQAGYGRSQVLFGLDFEVGEGEVVTLLGRNGMGKTTTIKCLTGLLAPSAGRIELAGRMLAGQPAHRIGQAG
ncbi:MAG TPA: ATP-binding cassette domain-containing protein, partial [Quisquiliibacterium sp.]|nr:ATP-binding cassette domain-containing protein [Quisquiliibacterium sp.]